MTATARAEYRRARSIDAIAVVQLDRWGRSLADLVTSMQELVELKVAFVSVADGIRYLSIRQIQRARHETVARVRYGSSPVD
jgi:DNA invertase Pin-like site-specific DNA recombinase